MYATHFYAKTWHRYIEYSELVKNSVVNSDVTGGKYNRNNYSTDSI